MIDITPLDVRKKKGDFAKAMRGYAPQEVDTFLDLVAERMEELVREVLTLRERAELLQSQSDAQTARERAVQEALVSAQSLRDDIREQARREAELFRREADTYAQRVLADAERAVTERRGVLDELERKRARFLMSLRQLLERELDLVAVEEGRPPLVDAPIDLDLGQKDGQRDGKGRTEADAKPMPGASGAGAPGVGELWLSGLTGEPPPD